MAGTGPAMTPRHLQFDGTYFGADFVLLESLCGVIASESWRSSNSGDAAEYLDFHFRRNDTAELVNAIPPPFHPNTI
jgi:hypothetical protein